MTRVLLAVSAGGDAMRRTVHETVMRGRDRYALRALVPDRESKAIRPLDIPVESWKPAGLFNVYRSAGALRRAVDRFDPEAIQAYGWTAAAVALGSLAGRYASRTTVYLQDPIREGEMTKPFVEKRLPALLARAASIACAYGTLRREIVVDFRLPEDLVRLEPFGVTPLTPDLARPAGRAGPIVGFVGPLDTERAWATAIDALALMWRSAPAARLWFANDGRLATPVKAYARRAGVADKLTFFENLPTAEFFSGIDLLAVPRMHDGLPYAAVEALASGMPVVAANVDGLADALAPFAGYLTPNTAGGLAAGIERAWAEIDFAWSEAREQRERAARAFDADAFYAAQYAEWDRLALLDAPLDSARADVQAGDVL